MPEVSGSKYTNALAVDNTLGYFLTVYAAKNLKYVWGGKPYNPQGQHGLDCTGFEEAVLHRLTGKYPVQLFPGVDRHSFGKAITEKFGGAYKVVKDVTAEDFPDHAIINFTGNVNHAAFVTLGRNGKKYVVDSTGGKSNTTANPGEGYRITPLEQYLRKGFVVKAEEIRIADIGKLVQQIPTKDRRLNHQELLASRVERGVATVTEREVAKLTNPSGFNRAIYGLHKANKSILAGKFPAQKRSAPIPQSKQALPNKEFTVALASKPKSESSSHHLN